MVVLCIFHVTVQFHSVSSLFIKCCVYVSPLSLSVTSLEVLFLWVRVLALAPDYEMTIACTAEKPPTYLILRVLCTLVVHTVLYHPLAFTPIQI